MQISRLQNRQVQYWGLGLCWFYTITPIRWHPTPYKLQLDVTLFARVIVFLSKAMPPRKRVHPLHVTHAESQETLAVSKVCRSRGTIDSHLKAIKRSCVALIMTILDSAHIHYSYQDSVLQCFCTLLYSVGGRSSANKHSAYKTPCFDISDIEVDWSKRGMEVAADRLTVTAEQLGLNPGSVTASSNIPFSGIWTSRCWAWPAVLWRVWM